MLKGYTALVKGNLVTGTIPSKGQRIPQGQLIKQ